jgi:hypothetical protein
MEVSPCGRSTLQQQSQSSAPSFSLSPPCRAVPKRRPPHKQSRPTVVREASRAGQILPMFPGYLQWQPILADLNSSDSATARHLNVGSDMLARVRIRVAGGIARSKQLRASASPEGAVAAAVLDTRDDLIRMLPQPAFDELQATVSARTSATAFTLPMRGKRVAEDSTVRCRVAVDFATDRHLVPEYMLWDLYFSSLAATATPKRLPDGTFPETFIADMRFGLNIAPLSMNHLLDIACDTTARIESLRASGTLERDIAAVVMSSRADLIRSLIPKEWAQIKRRAASSGGAYSFPPSW